MSENKQKFLIHGGILAITGILVRIIGMFYRIPLVNIIGEEGSGIYSVAFNIYNIMLVLSSYGMPMAVSKLMSACLAKKEYKNADKVYKCSLVVSAVTGGLAALILFFGADLIQSMYKGVNGLAIPLRVLAPTIFLVAMLGTVRGFYQGQGTMIPTAFSQLVEQIVNAVVSIVAALVLVQSFAASTEVAAFGAAGGTLGTCMGALSALIVLVVLYALYKPVFQKKVRRDRVSEQRESAEVYKLIGMTMVPIILSQTLYHICSVVDDIMFSNIMAGSSINIESDLGNYGSSYILLVGIPQGVASAMSSSMLPSVVASYTVRDFKAIRDKIISTIKTNMFIAIPSFVGLFVLGKPIIELLFPRYDSMQGSIMLKIGAAAVIFYTMSTVTSSALQGIDRMRVPVKHAAISVAIHVVLVFILLKFTNLGIYGVVIGNATFPILIFLLNLRALRHYVNFKLEYVKSFGVPLICAIIMGICSGLTYKLMYMLCESNMVSLMLALVMAALSYFGPLLLFRKKKMY